jgi:hypothetical protein
MFKRLLICLLALAAAKCIAGVVIDQLDLSPTRRIAAPKVAPRPIIPRGRATSRGASRPRPRGVSKLRARRQEGRRR